MTCKDCISFSRCKEMYETFGIFIDFDISAVCKHFKNKADFVKVVRCKDCKHCEDYDEPDEYGWYHCATHDMPTKLEHFCNFGERGDT